MTAPGSEIPAGSVVITPQDMWESIGRIEGAVTRIETQIGPQVADLRGDHEKLSGIVEENKRAAAADLAEVKNDHEQRIRTVEHANWKQAGIYAAITIATGLVELWYYATHH